MSKYILYLSACLLYAIIHTIGFVQLVPMPILQLFVDGLMNGAIITVLCYLVWTVLLYGNFEALTFFQRYANLVAMGMFFLITMLGGVYLFEKWYFAVNKLNVLVNILNVRGVIVLFIYIVLTQQFQLYKLNTISDESADLVQQEPEVTEISTINTDILDRITVKSGSKVHVIQVADIFYLQADGDYVQIITLDGKYLKEQTMKFFELNLPSDLFVRVHRSTIVNTEKISRIELFEKQTQQLTLKNGHQIRTSVAGYKALKLAMKL